MIGFSQKLWIALLILSITGIASFLPLFLFRKKTLPGWLLDADYFARGVFLGVGLLHLLPEAIGHWRSAFGANATFPWVYFICALTISLLIFSENLLEMQFNQDKRDYFYLILLVSMLVIHSFFEGLALGISLALSSFLLLLFAILAHKGIAAFALGIKFQTYRVQYQYLPLYLLLLFIISTPLGILVGGGLTQYFSHSATNTEYLNALFEAIAAGTFLYLAAFNELKMALVSSHRFLLFTKLLAYLLGLFSIAYLTHYHPF